MVAKITDREKERITASLSLLPDNVGTILEVGSRDGRVTLELARRAHRVTTLDLQLPLIEGTNVSGIRRFRPAPPDHTSIIQSL